MEAGSSEAALIIIDLCQVRATESYPDWQLWEPENHELGYQPLGERAGPVRAEGKAKNGFEPEHRVSVGLIRKSVVKA